MKRISVHYHEDDGAWWADSPDIDGWTAAADTLTELRTIVAEGVEFFVGDAAVDEVGLPVQEESVLQGPWANRTFESMAVAAEAKGGYLTFSAGRINKTISSSEETVSA